MNELLNSVANTVITSQKAQKELYRLDPITKYHIYKIHIDPDGEAEIFLHSEYFKKLFKDSLLSEVSTRLMRNPEGYIVSVFKTIQEVPIKLYCIMNVKEYEEFSQN